MSEQGQEPPQVQLQNPVTRRWVLVDTKTGRVVGARATPWPDVPKAPTEALTR